uniref:Uncharacterized protein n=1 Tax=Lactuca sativa TaxID=4236 RepID=A0A9R1UIT2_LACSA|nr:hypothetical protein LSAT_V11C900496850 [Lactuca sativa]
MINTLDDYDDIELLIPKGYLLSHSKYISDLFKQAQLIGNMIVHRSLATNALYFSIFDDYWFSFIKSEFVPYYSKESVLPYCQSPRNSSCTLCGLLVCYCSYYSSLRSCSLCSCMLKMILIEIVYLLIASRPFASIFTLEIN